ncbi:MAG: DUF2917 domain-containing protein [Anaerolineales bacterium]|nr:DUF2917 domain-containing protein [Anaerolineales bacterium]
MKTQILNPTSSFPVAQGADVCKDSVHLKNKEITSLKIQGERIHLKCLSGIVWITQTGDPEDHVLQANESLDISKKGEAVLQALPEAVICW